MSALEAVLKRDRAVVVAALASTAALAWMFTIWLAQTMEMGAMNGHDGSAMNMGAMLAPEFRPWAPHDFAYMFVM